MDTNNQRLYAIYKDGELFRTSFSQNAYRRKRDAKKVITEQIQKDTSLAERFEIVIYESIEE